MKTVDFSTVILGANAQAYPFRVQRQAPNGQQQESAVGLTFKAFFDDYFRNLRSRTAEEKAGYPMELATKIATAQSSLDLSEAEIEMLKSILVKTNQPDIVYIRFVELTA